MLGGCLVVLVLHLEHDGYILHVILALVAEDEIAFRTLHHFVVFLEISVREERPDPSKLRSAMLLQRLTYHFRGQTQFHVLVVRYLLLHRFQLLGHLRAQRGQLLIFLQILLGRFLPNLRYRQLFLLLRLRYLRLQSLYLRLHLLLLQLLLSLHLLFLQFLLRLYTRLFGLLTNGLMLLQLMDTTRQLGLKLVVLDLIQQHRVVRLIHGKRTAAFGTF